MLPRSPRARRRLLALAVTLTLALAAVVIALLLPGPPGRDEERFHGPADVVAKPTTRVSEAQRVTITDTLARFMADGIARGDIAAAWQIAGPGLRGSTTRESWIAGDVPFLEYGAQPFGTDAWRVIDASGGHVVLDLFVQPAEGSTRGPATFTFDVRRLGGAWQIQSVYASVLFSADGERPGVISAGDFGAPGAGDPRRDVSARLSGWWLLTPFALFAALLVALAFALRRTRRRRSATL